MTTNEMYHILINSIDALALDSIESVTQWGTTSYEMVIYDDDYVLAKVHNTPLEKNFDEDGIVSCLELAGVFCGDFDQVVDDMFTWAIDHDLLSMVGE